MNNIYTFLLIIVTCTSSIYVVLKWIKENRKYNNSITIGIESLKISGIISIFNFLFIVLLYFIKVSDNFIGDITLMTFVSILLISMPISVIAFLLKERFKMSFSDIIHRDFIKYTNKIETWYKTINQIQSVIAEKILENDFNYKRDLDDSQRIYHSMPKMSYISKKYNRLCTWCWLGLGSLNGLMIWIILETSQKNIVAYIISSMFVTTIIFIVNTLNVYSDLKIKYGKNSAIITKIKRHNEYYNKLLKEKEREF